MRGWRLVLPLVALLVPAPMSVASAARPAASKVPATPCADGKYFAQYYDEMKLAAALLKGTRCETSVNKNWGIGAPGFGLHDNWFSVRWTTRARFDAQVYGNTVWGNSGGIGPDGRAFVQMHPGSGTVERNVVRNNAVSKYWAVVNAAGSGHTIRDNCMTEVTKLYAYTFSGPVTIAGNGPC